MIKLMLHYAPTLLLMTVVGLFSCKTSNPYGTKVKEPFQGSPYESNNRFFRATGKGVSAKDNIARGKADIAAKNQLAGQVNTNMRAVADQYLGQTENENAAEVADKFQSLVREVMNTNLADLRKIGEEKFIKDTQYTVFIAYEIKKSAMLRFMKKQARTDKKINQKQRALIEKIIDKELEEMEKGE